MCSLRTFYKISIKATHDAPGNLICINLADTLQRMINTLLTYADHLTDIIDAVLDILLPFMFSCERDAHGYQKGPKVMLIAGRAY